MNENHEQLAIDVEAVGTPNRDTFDLDVFIDERSTFPIIEHIVYLDQNSGYRLAELGEEIENLEGTARSLQQRAREEREDSVLAMGEMTPAERALENVKDNLEILRSHYVQLEQTVRESALLLELQCEDYSSLGAIQENAVKEFRAKHSIPVSQAEDEMPDQLKEKQARFIMASYMAALCIRITRHDGVCQPAPISPATIEKLQSRLAPNEVRRLDKAFRSVFDVSKQWAESIDAGFPGRVTNLGK